MTNKNKKLILICFLYSTFLIACFFSLSINRASALNLEVQYPEKFGSSLTAESKFPDFAIFLFNAGMSLGIAAVFISLTIAGAMYFLSSVSAEMRANAKDRVSGAISGLLILILTYLIITTINPQLSIFHLDELSPSPTSPTDKEYPGVYFYKETGCPDTDKNTQNNTANVLDLGPLKNTVNSVKILNDPATKRSFVPIIYENTNLWGKCQYLSPNTLCHNLATPFAASASIHIYDFTPNGDGVMFYRKSYFNDKGGWYKIPNSQINDIYIEKLENLKFQGVPEKEQDCIKYDKMGDCTERKMPSLSGENISSVKIQGNYLVLFVYFGPGDTPNGPWTFCQEFPTQDDINKLGPQQIKWENIRNSSKGVIPNYIIIIPTQ